MTSTRWGPVLVVLAVLASFALLAGVCSAKGPESAFNRDPWPMVKEGPVKVFILAGQSNMQGHAAFARWNT